MKIATILPTRYLHLVEKDSYHMCLAQLVNVDLEYTAFYRSLSAQKDKFIILDNGAAEGEQPTFKQLIPKIQTIKPNEVVLPDTVYDNKSTIDKGIEALAEAAHFFPQRTFNFMAVPQGATSKDWQDCARELLQWPIATIGISKFLTRALHSEARMQAVIWLIEEMYRTGNIKDIHLLGCENHPLELHNIVQRVPQAAEYVRGSDSAIAYVYAHEGIEISKHFVRPQFEMHFTDTPKLSEELEKLLKDNIRIWREYGHDMQ